MIESSVVTEQLVVLDGSQAGASIDVSENRSFRVGSAYHNEVVLQCCQQPVSVQIEEQNGHRYIKLLEGSARIRHGADSSVELVSEELIKITSDTVVEFDDVAFAVKNTERADSSDTTQSGHKSAGHGKRTFAMASMAAGMALLAALGFHDYWMAGASVEEPHLSITQQLENNGLAGVRVLDELRDDGSTILQGRVDNQEQFQQVKQIVADTDTPVKLDVQIDSVLVDALEDVYRNHGVDTDISVLGKGYVKIEMQGVSEETLESIEAALKDDVPMLQKMDTINLPAEETPEQTERAVLDPDKEIEAVVAGDVSYVMTRDQARYFVGAVLPSGYTIKSITDGTVVMAKEGEETTLNF